MLIKFNKNLFLFLLFTQTSVFGFDTIKNCWNKLDQDQKDIIKIVSVIPLVYGTYKLAKTAYSGIKNSISSKLEESFEEEAVESIILFFKFVGHCSQEELQKKARMIRIRKQVLQNLEKQAPENLQVKNLKLLFSGIDFVRGWFARNPFEDQGIGIVDSVFEAKIASSITDSVLLSFKDNKNCTKEELEQKDQSKISRNRIIQRVVPELETKVPLLVKVVMAIFFPGFFIVLKTNPLFIDFFFPVR